MIVVPISSVVCILDVKFIVKGTYKSSSNFSWCIFNLSSISFKLVALTGVTLSIHLGLFLEFLLSKPWPTFNSPALKVPHIAFEGGFNKVNTIEFTNASGYVESYDIYKSTNSNLGNTTVVVS